MPASRSTPSALADALAPALEPRPLPHERLDVFRVAIELVELTATLGSGRGTAGALDQLRRAATSVAVNIGEACGKRGADRRRFFEIARGSALESAAARRVLWALRVIKTEQHANGRTLCERLYAMLTRLCVSRR